MGAFAEVTPLQKITHPWALNLGPYRVESLVKLYCRLFCCAGVS